MPTTDPGEGPALAAGWAISLQDHKPHPQAPPTRVAVRKGRGHMGRRGHSAVEPGLALQATRAGDGSSPRAPRRPASQTPRRGGSTPLASRPCRGASWSGWWLQHRGSLTQAPDAREAGHSRSPVAGFLEQQAAHILSRTGNSQPGTVRGFSPMVANSFLLHHDF